MRLRKPCEHDRYDPHSGWDGEKTRFSCPGGEFLPDDALVIHKDADGEWPKWALMALDGMIRHPASYVLGVLAKAAASQVGEPGTFKPSRRHEALLEYLNEETP